MIRKVLIGAFAVVALLVAAGFLLRDHIPDLLVRAMTDDMFLDADTNDFDPGFDGNVFPGVHVAYRGEVLSELTQFSGERGLVVLFSRSVMW